MYNLITEREERDMFVTIPIEHYERLVRNETRLETIGRMLTEKVSNNNYADVTDLKIILGIREDVKSETV